MANYRYRRRVPRGGFGGPAIVGAAAALAAARKNAKRLQVKPKPKKKKRERDRITRRDIELTKKGNPPKKVKKILDAPNHFIKHQTQVESCKINVNGKVKTATSTEDRLVQQAPPSSPTGIVFSLKGVTPSASNKPKDNLNGRSLFSVPQLKLPQGSKLSSIITMGRNALPSKSIATPVDIVMFKSDLGGGFDDGSPDLTKSPAMMNKIVGLNMVHNMLIPLELPNLAYKRLLSTKKFTKSSVENVTDDLLRKLYDPNNAAPDDNSNLYNANDGGVRSVYCPHKRQAIYTVNNIQRFLSLKVKIHICQIKQPSFEKQSGQHVTYIDPQNAFFRAWNAMMPNARIPSAGDGSAGNPLVYDIKTDLLKSPVSPQLVWGMKNDEFIKMVGSWHVNTTFPSTLRSSPTFDETFNVIKSLSYNVGPGCSREINVTRHLNSNFASYGKFNLNTPPSSDNEGRANYDTETRLFALVEVHGKESVQYYQFKKGDATANPPVPDERLWSVAKTGPARFSQSLEMRSTVGTVPHLIDTDEDDGCVYRRNYLTLNDINHISRKVYVAGNRIAESEEKAVNTGDITFIVPVNTPDGQQVAAGQPAIIPEKTI